MEMAGLIFIVQSIDTIASPRRDLIASTSLWTVSGCEWHVSMRILYCIAFIDKGADCSNGR